MDHQESRHPDSLEVRLNVLDSRLQKNNKNHPLSTIKSDNANFGNAIRLSTEFVVAILVGIGMGWGIDHFFNTTPWAMIVCLPLGFVAGVRNIMRAAGLQTNSNTQTSCENQNEK